WLEYCNVRFGTERLSYTSSSDSMIARSFQLSPGLNQLCTIRGHYHETVVVTDVNPRCGIRSREFSYYCGLRRVTKSEPILYFQRPGVHEGKRFFGVQNISKPSVRWVWQRQPSFPNFVRGIESTFVERLGRHIYDWLRFTIGCPEHGKLVRESLGEAE